MAIKGNQGQSRAIKGNQWQSSRAPACDQWYAINSIEMMPESFISSPAEAADKRSMRARLSGRACSVCVCVAVAGCAGRVLEGSGVQCACLCVCVCVRVCGCGCARDAQSDESRGATRDERRARRIRGHRVGELRLSAQAPVRRPTRGASRTGNQWQSRAING
eukprot:2927750-Prymnesium_polylepis.3